MASKKVKTNIPSTGTEIKSTKANPFKWVLLAFGILALIVLANYLFVKRVEESKTSNDTSIGSPSSAIKSTGSNEAASTESTPPPLENVSDLPKKIVGDWKVIKRLVGGFPAGGSGRIGTGAWQFYEDGSLKFTTGQYADLGTWNLDNGNFSVSLYALGKYSGYISSIDSKSMIWVTNEIIDGNSVAVSNYFLRIK